MAYGSRLRTRSLVSKAASLTASLTFSSACATSEGMEDDFGPRFGEIGPNAVQPSLVFLATGAFVGPITSSSEAMMSASGAPRRIPTL